MENSFGVYHFLINLFFFCKSELERERAKHFFQSEKYFPHISSPCCNPVVSCFHPAQRIKSYHKYHQESSTACYKYFISLLVSSDHCDVTMRYDKQSCYHNDAQWVDTGHCVIWYCGHKTQHMVQSILTHPVWSQNQVMTIHPELSDNKLNWCNISDKRITTFRSQSGFCPNHWNHLDFQ